MSTLEIHLVGSENHLPMSQQYSSMTSSLLTVNQAPKGTKLWLLHLGNLEADIGFLVRGGGTSTKSNPNPESQRGKAVIIGALIEHPTEGLILFETGAGPDYPGRLLLSPTWGSRRHATRCLES